MINGQANFGFLQAACQASEVLRGLERLPFRAGEVPPVEGESLLSAEAVDVVAGNVSVGVSESPEAHGFADSRSAVHAAFPAGDAASTPKTHPEPGACRTLAGLALAVRGKTGRAVLAASGGGRMAAWAKSSGLAGCLAVRLQSIAVVALFALPDSAAAWAQARGNSPGAFFCSDGVAARTKFPSAAVPLASAASATAFAEASETDADPLCCLLVDALWTLGLAGGGALTAADAESGRLALAVASVFLCLAAVLLRNTLSRSHDVPFPIQRVRCGRGGRVAATTCRPAFCTRLPIRLQCP